MCAFLWLCYHNDIIVIKIIVIIISLITFTVIGIVIINATNVDIIINEKS